MPCLDFKDGLTRILLSNNDTIFVLLSIHISPSLSFTMDKEINERDVSPDVTQYTDTKYIT